ncbi:type II secretion system protein [Idiomarina sp.]|uniref:type II secretion system protein n=1 Tax=Idiomarina sp. TaxID=1874361 RepID=UPI0025C0D521|nr:type II secretion system protein [Idiomarina sp.]
MRNQKGFTLIELIIVIVVLGILAVTAAPQFVDFSTDARSSAVKGLKGSLQGASQTIYARAAVDGSLDGTKAAPVTVEGIDTVFGYPAASQAGIVAASQLEAITGAAGAGTDTSQYDWVYTVESNTDPAANVVYISPIDVVTLPETLDGTNECYVSYTEATDGTRPEIAVDTSGC